MEISEDGIRPKNSRFSAVLEIKPRRTLKEVRSFLGAVQYLVKFIPKLSEKAQAIRELLKKNYKWEWMESQQLTFYEIKLDIADLKSLKHYDRNAETLLTTDASNKGLGAALWQKVEGGRRPVAFASRFLSNSEQNYALNELELFPIKCPIEQFKYQLMGRKFTVETDHRALLPIFNKNCIEKQYSSRLIRWR